jgi:hypothetical protein
MARGLYKGSKKAIQTTRQRVFAELAAQIKDADQLSEMLLELTPKQRPGFLELVKPYLKFQYE